MSLQSSYLSLRSLGQSRNVGVEHRRAHVFVTSSAKEAQKASFVGRRTTTHEPSNNSIQALYRRPTRVFVAKQTYSDYASALAHVATTV